MAEAITEMILPGTYIDVRAEGLIGVGGISTGNVGIVGTASKGVVNEAVILSSFAEAREVFGSYDAWVDGNSDELTLVRALQQAFTNGASTVYAVRTGKTGIVEGGYILRNTSGNVVALKAKTKGTWCSDISVQATDAVENGYVEALVMDVGASGPDDLHANIAASPRNAVKIVKGTTGKVIRLKLVTTGGAVAGAAVAVDAAGAMTFHVDDLPENGDTLIASYEVTKTACRSVTITWENVKEVYTCVDATDLARDINAASTLVTATVSTGSGSELPDKMDEAMPLTGGSNGADAGTSEYTASLEVLDAEPINLVTLAGLAFTDASEALLGHVEKAENAGKERIAIVGADKDGASDVAANADAVADDRLILVGPGIKTTDLVSGISVTLPPAYAAACVTGLIASLAVHTSPTNKTVKVSGLSKDYNDGEKKNLLNNRVFVLEKKAGYRVVKGISTDTGAFKQISVRRITDYAKEGVRKGTLPYIGKLNNARVRAAMQGTLNGFLSQMVMDEQLVSYDLDVSATREQEINGIALVTLYLKPTFSIDYIKVIMNLS